MIKEAYEFLVHHLDDWEYRSVFADWLFEHNNPLEKAQRWMIENKKHPVACGFKYLVFGTDRNDAHNTKDSNYFKCILPDDIFVKIHPNKNEYWEFNHSLQELEEKLAKVL